MLPHIIGDTSIVTVNPIFVGHITNIRILHQFVHRHTSKTLQNAYKSMC
jgi:hypothetical protein